MFGDLASLNDLRKNRGLLKNIIWDIEPKRLMEPRCRITDAGEQERETIDGFLFYIDKMTGMKPALYLMCHTESGYAETVAKIDELPEELMQEAVDENRSKEYFGMYPINKKIEDWLRRELGINGH